MPPPSEIPLFATNNLTSLEPYLFLNHPTTFVPLTSNYEDEHHTYKDQTPLSSKPGNNTSTLTTQKPHVTSKDLHLPPATDMQSEHSSASATSTAPIGIPTTPDSTPSYLGGGATRPHSSHTEHSLEELAALSASHLARRNRRELEERQQQQQGGRQRPARWMMEWWPLPASELESVEWAEYGSYYGGCGKREVEGEGGWWSGRGCWD